MLYSLKLEKIASECTRTLLFI